MDKVCEYLSKAHVDSKTCEILTIEGDTCYLIPACALGKGAHNQQTIAVNLNKKQLWTVSEKAVQLESRQANNSPERIPGASPSSYSTDPAESPSQWTLSTTSRQSSPLSIEVDFDSPVHSPKAGGLFIDTSDESPTEAGGLFIDTSDESSTDTSLPASRAHAKMPQDLIKELTGNNTTAKSNNIVPTYTGINENTLYKASEFCRGGDGKKYILEQNDPEKILKIATGLLNGLQFLHGEGYVHRDIKLENILIDLDANDQPTALLGDFDGLMTEKQHRQKNKDIEKDGFTEAYAAPELLEDSPAALVGRATDLFSAGIVLAQLAKRITMIEEKGVQSITLEFTKKRQEQSRDNPFSDPVEVHLRDVDLNGMSQNSNHKKFAQALLDEAKTLLSNDPESRGSAQASLERLQRHLPA